MVKYICPECGSPKVNQYRMPFGPMWCTECDYRVEAKESDDTFVNSLGTNDDGQCPVCGKYYYNRKEIAKRVIEEILESKFIYLPDALAYIRLIDRLKQQGGE